MMKTIFSRVMWLARGTSMVLGLAVMLALVFGITATALAAVPGDPFKLGKKNSINKLSSLVGTVAGPLLRIDNNGTGPALDLQVGSATDPSQNTVAPLTVNSQQKVDNLNADKLDGLDSSDLKVGCPTGTTFFGGAGCIEDTEPSPMADFSTASSTCAGLGRRLPTAAELDAFRQQPNIVIGGSNAPYEWTGDIIDEIGGPPNTLVMGDEGHYDLGAHHPTVRLGFRCVVSPSN